MLLFIAFISFSIFMSLDLVISAYVFNLWLCSFSFIAWWYALQPLYAELCGSLQFEHFNTPLFTFSLTGFATTSHTSIVCTPPPPLRLGGGVEIWKLWILGGGLKIFIFRGGLSY